MRIGIFGVMAGAKAGGPEIYEINLVRNLAAIDRENEYHIFCPGERAIHAYNIQTDNFFFHILRPASRWISIPFSLPYLLVRNKLDFYHATFTPSPFSPLPFLFTHHCFSTFVHKEFYDPAILFRLNRLINKGIKKARLCLCVSENVRQLTIEKFKVDPEKMLVIYNGVAEDFRPMQADICDTILKDKYRVDFPYFLYVGKIQNRKNIVRLIHAFYHLKQETGTDAKLILIGRRMPPLDNIDAVIKELGLRDEIVEFGYVANEELPIFYNRAISFVFPSLWEGFGIPVVEAMACGTPVITSRISSLPEISGEAAILVDPYQEYEIAAAMYGIMTDTSLRDKLRKEGLERARKFSWQETARKTLEAYRRMKF